MSATERGDGMRRCTKCGESKLAEAFSKDSRARDGIRVWCRQCCSAYGKRHYRENPKSEDQKAIERERTLKWIREHPERHKAGAEAYKKRHPKKAKAWNKVTNAIRLGDLIPQPCEVCGETEVDAHHEDYSKQLDVNWLCRRHHAEADVARRRRLESGVA